MSSSLPYFMEQQEQNNWCWSAVAVSVNSFRSGMAAWSQCALANAELGQTSCCANGSSLVCDQLWLLEAALLRVGWLNGLPAAVAPSWAALKGEIDSLRPVGVRIGWFGGGGHFVLITGYDDSNPADIELEIQDPRYGPSDEKWNSFPSTYEGGGAWTHTYYIL